MLRISLLFGLAVPVAALAEPPSVSHAEILDSGGHYRGVLSVNQAAGDRQQQANTRSLAIGAPATAAGRLVQEQTPDGAANVLEARSSIRGDAFSNGRGVLGVNQSSGSGNQQSNALHVSVGARVENLDDGILAQQSVMPSQDSDLTETSPGRRAVDTDNRAFAGSKGVVQLSQSAGVGNRMGNTISIRVMD